MREAAVMLVGAALDADRHNISAQHAGELLNLCMIWMKKTKKHSVLQSYQVLVAKCLPFCSSCATIFKLVSFKKSPGSVLGHCFSI